MRGNIKARETLQMLLEYPTRIYPEPEEIDPKKKDKKAPPKKKKKFSKPRLSGGALKSKKDEEPKETSYWR